MPDWRDLIPPPPKEKCDHCGREADLMDYGPGMRVCSMACLFDIDPSHPALNGCSEEWKREQVLLTERARIDRELLELRTRKE